MKKLALTVTAAAALVAGASQAAIPAYPANPDVVWKGNFEEGVSSLSGNCNYGDNGWCAEQSVRNQQIQIVDDPAFEGHHAVRFEVKYGDAFRNYSDERSLLSPPPQMWEDEGSERWYRFQVMFPQDWVGSYPKWDELGTPASRSNAGSIVEWHHDAAGAVETGSAPLYIRGGDQNIEMCLVDHATSACRETIQLAPINRGHWQDIVIHAKWSSDPSVGFLEIWIDGANVLPKHMGPNKYAGMKNYLLTGLYRNAYIGDPNLLYPDGAHVYGTDGAPGVAYVDGFIAGKTKESVLPPTPEPVADGSPTPTPPASGSSAPSGTPEPATTNAPVSAGGLLGQGGGCSSTGFQSAWLALPLFGLFAMRRRRTAA